jgi:hypothetical protein
LVQRYCFQDFFRCRPIAVGSIIRQTGRDSINIMDSVSDCSNVEPSLENYELMMKGGFDRSATFSVQGEIVMPESFGVTFTQSFLTFPINIGIWVEIHLIPIRYGYN